MAMILLKETMSKHLQMLLELKKCQQGSPSVPIVVFLRRTIPLDCLLEVVKRPLCDSLMSTSVPKSNCGNNVA